MNTKVKRDAFALIISVLLIIMFSSETAFGGSLTYEVETKITGAGQAAFDYGPNLDFYHSDGIKSLNQKCKIKNNGTYKFSNLISRGIVVKPDAKALFDGIYNEKGKKMQISPVKMDIFRVTVCGIYVYDQYPSYENPSYSNISKELYNSFFKNYLDTKYGKCKYKKVGEETLYPIQRKSQLINIKFKKKETLSDCVTSCVSCVYGDKPFSVTDSMPDDAVYTCSSSNSKVVSVNKTTGKCTIKGEGIARITVKVKDSEKYIGGTFKSEIKVKPNSVSRVKAKKEKGTKKKPKYSFKISWSPDKKSSGYEIQLSDSKSFNRIYSRKVITSASASSNSVKVLKKAFPKCKYVRIRAFKKSCNKVLYGIYTIAPIA